MRVTRPSGTPIADVLVGAPVVIGSVLGAVAAVQVPRELVSPGVFISPP